jgi:primary-amine oxidase
LNAFYFKGEDLDTELAAQRDCDSYSGRFWSIYNPNVVTRIGSNPSYKLVPLHVARPFAPLDKAPHLKRANFLAHQLWVTAYQENERFPAGDFPNQNPNSDGLCEWIKQNRNISNTDIVVWHVFGTTHLPRPEDFPVMPVEHCGFKLKPFGFFDTSPALDIPILPHYHQENTAHNDKCPSCVETDH